ncbi:CidA/LrgA family protein [uncultured Duncaniella sp.]|uniref:CidA/LrgA family protein n=1 Tax=uncultured Duncaniella sp. TaxID=2768039 RepID=UPI00265AF563|nr:CidA/LrgA family protein [uncultured Duncaniella sp.]
MVKQCSVIFGCLAVGEFIVWLTGISIPGSILGMLLLTALLEKKVIKVEDVGPMCRFLVSNMGFFFVPPGVALMLYFDIIADSWLAITVATLVSTALVLLVTGRVHQYFRHAVHRK